MTGIFDAYNFIKTMKINLCLLILFSATACHTKSKKWENGRSDSITVKVDTLHIKDSPISALEAPDTVCVWEGKRNLSKNLKILQTCHIVFDRETSAKFSEQYGSNRLSNYYNFDLDDGSSLNYSRVGDTIRISLFYAVLAWNTRMLLEECLLTTPKRSFDRSPDQVS